MAKNEIIDHYKVKEDASLLEVLQTMYRGRSKSSIKKLIASGMVLINGESTKDAVGKVTTGSVITIAKAPKAVLKANMYLSPIFEDDHIIVINKMPGVNTNAINKFDTNSVFHILRNYMQQSNPNNKIFIVHRLDKDTSGILVFAKSLRIREALQEKWHDKKRMYIAVVEGEVIKEKGSITSWLTETKELKMISSQVRGHGKEAVTRFEVLQQNELYSLLQIEILTGRKNQIRVHMQDLGHPVAGDEKYGAVNNPLKRLCLHAQLLEFDHPVSGERMKFESEAPAGFDKLTRPKQQ